MLDTKHEYFQRGPRTIPITREQADTGAEASEESLARDFVWRRSIESWDQGAGQKFLDKKASTPFRFWASQGVDVWTKGQFSLLPAVNLDASATATNQVAVPVGSYVYRAEGATLKRSTNLSAWTSITTGAPTSSITSLASDGYNVYQANGAQGIYITNTGSTSLASYVTGSVTTVDYVKGRLMAAQANSVYNITSAVTSTGNALPTALLTHANPGFSWTCFAEGAGFIYMGGYAGDKSLIYKVSIREDGTALDSPTVATSLPDGDLVVSMCGYQNFLLLGLTDGFRLCELDASGQIVGIGAKVDTTSSVLCFEPQGQFVWFGWTNYATGYTGLGRIDLTETNAGGPLVPAYASDLMAGTTGAVQSVLTFADERVFTVSGAGLYSETTNKVTSGYLDTGFITFGVQEKKVAQTVDFKTLPLAGSVTVALANDNEDFTDIGTQSTAETIEPSEAFELASRRGQKFKIRFTLTRDGTTTTTGPTITNATLRAYPIVDSSKQDTLPLLLSSTFMKANNQEASIDTLEAYSWLVDLADSSLPVSLQQLGKTYTATIVDHEFQRHQINAKRNWYEGTMVLLVNIIGD